MMMKMMRMRAMMMMRTMMIHFNALSVLFNENKNMIFKN